jgi:hypothetical protein
MSDYFKRMEILEKEQREELSNFSVRELYNLDWMKVRLKPNNLETSLREGIDEFTYDILSHEKEMKQCPKLEELLVNIVRRKLRYQLPCSYTNIVEQSDHDEYLQVSISIEEIIISINSYLMDALDRLDFENFEENKFIWNTKQGEKFV